MKRAPAVHGQFQKGRRAVLFLGDCMELLEGMPEASVDLTITSPPYCMGKQYEASRSVRDFEETHRKLAPLIRRVTKPGGSICWQVGYHVEDSGAVPLDALVYPLFMDGDELVLRNRIVWTFGHGLHSKKRFSGRHEMVLWFTKKGGNYKFALDDVRLPQKYPGKKHYKGAKKGAYSGNPRGKNPEDVWAIPNVKANHVEKTKHPCQFPVGLVQRLIRALTAPGDLVLDPFAGSGTSGAAALLDKRRFVGAEIDPEYHQLAHGRLVAAMNGTLVYRDGNRPVYTPNGKSGVEKKPPDWD